MKTKRTVFYETQICTQNTLIRAKGTDTKFASMLFRNVGDTDATILKDILLPAQSIFSEYGFINDPLTEIGSDILVEFVDTTGATTKRVEVVKVYYNENQN